MDYKLKELRRKLDYLKRATEKPYKFDPERHWESEIEQWYNYQDNLSELSEIETAFFAHLQEKKRLKKELQTRSL